MGAQMEHNLEKPNKNCYYLINIQDNPFANSPIFISIEDHEFSLPLIRKVIVLGVDTRTPTHQDLQTFPRIILSPELYIGITG